MVNWVEDHTGVSWLWRGRFAVIEGFAAVESSDEEFLGLRLSILSAKTHTTTVRHSDFPTQFSAPGVSVDGGQQQWPPWFTTREV
jgi:hypothetical protein